MFDSVAVVKVKHYLLYFYIYVGILMYYVKLCELFYVVILNQFCSTRIHKSSLLKELSFSE